MKWWKQMQVSTSSNLWAIIPIKSKWTSHPKTSKASILLRNTTLAKMKCNTTILQMQHWRSHNSKIKLPKSWQAFCTIRRKIRKNSLRFRIYRFQWRISNCKIENSIKILKVTIFIAIVMPLYSIQFHQAEILSITASWKAPWAAEIPKIRGQSVIQAKAEAWRSAVKPLWRFTLKARWIRCKAYRIRKMRRKWRSRTQTTR